MWLWVLHCDVLLDSLTYGGRNSLIGIDQFCVQPHARCCPSVLVVNYLGVRLGMAASSTGVAGARGGRPPPARGMV